MKRFFRRVIPSIIIFGLVVTLNHSINYSNITSTDSYMVFLVLIPFGFVISTIFIFIIRSVLSKRSATNNIPFVKDYFDSRTNDQRICLILRPFGSDGKTPIEALGGEYIWDRYFFSWFKPVSMESLIQKEVSEVLNIETMAIVDQRLKKTPKSPTYLRATLDWKQDVLFLLQEKASVLFILIPPGQVFRESLEWELDQARKEKFAGRIIFVISPMRRSLKLKAVKSLKEVLEADFPDNMLMTYKKPNSEEYLKFQPYFLGYPSKLMINVSLHIYQEMIRGVLVNYVDKEVKIYNKREK